MQRSPTQEYDESMAAIGHPPTAPEHLPAVVEEDESGAMARWSTDQPIVASNMDQSGPAGMALVTRALGTADIRTRSAIGQILPVVGYAAHVAELTDQATGEVTRKVRVIMFLEDGRTLSTMSGPCVRAIRYLSQVAGRQRWNPPCYCEIREHPLEAGKSYCDLRVIDPDDPRLIAYLAAKLNGNTREVAPNQAPPTKAKR